VTFKADKNKDGKLSPDEFPDPAFREAVVKLDRNGDGGIDAQEWNGALQRVAENSLLAVEPGGKRERWRMTKGLSDVPSPLFYKDGLYRVKDGGIVTRIDPKTGAAVKQARLTGALDKYFASPVAGDGKIYFTSQACKIAAVKAGGDLDILAVNDLAEECYATPAIASGGLYVRTAEALYFFASRSAG
jgi:outer membrane protein assembly factor BamB